MTDPAAPRFIFHIGAGKTGTSSVQSTLKQAVEPLRRQGVWYLGLMFEHSPVEMFSWQRFGGQDEFLSLPAPQQVRELRRVLLSTVRRAIAAKAHTLIWSSESFFDRHNAVFEPLREAIELGVKLQVLCYVRSHEAWVKSAYVQWGLKHKTYPGPIRPFGTWVKGRQPLFAPTLQRFERELPGTLAVRNYDTVGDVVADFLAVCGLDGLGLAPVRDNASPDNAELLLRALYNGGLREDALPMRFDRAVADRLLPQASASDYLASLYPTEADLEAVLDTVEPDREQVNTLLAASDTPPLVRGTPRPRSPAVDDAELLFALAQVVAGQARRLEALEATVRRLQADAPTADAPAAAPVTAVTPATGTGTA